MRAKPAVVYSIGLALLLSLAPVAGWAQQNQLLAKDSEKIDFAHGLLEQSMFSLAAAQFEEFIQLFPQSPFLEDAYMGAGESHFFLKEYDRAAALFQTYLDKFPSGKSKGSALVRLGQCVYLMGQADDALAKFSAVNAAELTPPFVQTLYFFLGKAQATKGNYKDAAASFEKAAQAPNATAYTAQAYFQWADALSHTAEYPAALEKASKALELAATDQFKVSALMKLGEINFLAGQFAQSADAFKKVIDQYPSLPTVPDATANWMTALLNQKQFDELIAQYNQKYKDNLQPAYIPVHLIAAKALSAAGKNDEAIAVLDKMIDLPAMTPAQKNKAMMQKADLLVRSGRFADAIAVIDADPSSQSKPSVMTLKAQSYLGLKDFDKAWAVYENLTKNFANDPAGIEAICGMAHVRLTQNLEEEAAALFTDCFNKRKDEPGRSQALYNAFLSYEKANLTDKAIGAAEQYLQTYPQGERIAAVTAVLAELYAKNKQYDKSLAILTPLLNDPDESRRLNAVFQVAYINQTTGKTDEALAGYEKIIADHKTQDQIYYLTLRNSFILYVQKNDEVKAADVLERSIREFDNNNVPLQDYLWLAQHWMDYKDGRAMMVVLDAAQKHHASSPGAIGIKYFTGEALRLQNNCPEAIKMYDETINAADSGIYKGRARLGKGMCLSSVSDYQGAQKEWDKAIAENPEDHFVAMRSRFELAQNNEQQKKMEDAAKAYLVVSVLYKDPYYSPESLLRAGGIFQQLNNKPEALNAYRQLVSAYPMSAQAAKAQTMIDQLK